jgi:hypothetical protein
MRFFVDTNVLLYAVNRDCAEHALALPALKRWLEDPVPWCLSWGVIYEFLRVSTHPRVFPRPLTWRQALEFVSAILSCEWVTVLAETQRHSQVLATTLEELGRPAGNLFHDVHSAVLMREHGVEEVMTTDADFRQFAFLKATDPTR